ncbi:hypothetical protein [Pseudonocardia xishanensis]
MGDPVCWLGRLCPECGAMPTEDSPERCWRCAEPYPPRREEPEDGPPPGGSA